MSNKKRKRSEYQFELSTRQLEAFLEIALKQDRPLEEVILGALDRFIETENKHAKPTKTGGGNAEQAFEQFSRKEPSINSRTQVRFAGHWSDRKIRRAPVF
jgi:hypothetical protein